MRLIRNVAAGYIVLFMALELGAILSQKVGTAAAVGYGVVVVGLLALLALRWRRPRP